MTKSRFRGFSFIVLALVFWSSSALAQLGPDFDWTTVRTPPTFPHPTLATPRVGVDATNSLVETIDWKLHGFAELLRADGYIVESVVTPYDELACEIDLNQCGFLQELAGFDSFVLSNPSGLNPLSVGEANAILGWLDGSLACSTPPCDGRSLLLNVDHLPLTMYAVNLTTALGLDWLDVFTGEPVFDGAATANQTLHTSHVVARGLATANEVGSFRVWGGSAIDPLTSSATLSPVMSFEAGAPIEDELGVIIPDTEGLIHAATMEYGTGRVFLSGDIASLTAQNSFACDTLPCIITPVGISVLEYDNLELVLNAMHWLSGLLPDDDGDEWTDVRDNCLGVANEDQRDSDGDGYGNACDPDYNDDGQVTTLDYDAFYACFTGGPGTPDDPNCEESDHDDQPGVSVSDFSVFLYHFTQQPASPGPSGLDCAGTSGCAAP